ncbi:MAG: restriction endonuclease subunit S [Gammaproteobacteria bacterium]|nr:restriction endonuclease subunit S [Gammaproteobacteria bacterium]
MREGWKISALRDCCQIKPPKKQVRDLLSPGDMVSFVPMSDLGIREKGLNATEDRPFRSVSGSYTYFADGDVLLAKITPCFENGKLGIAQGLTNGVGFGSSEFIVFRPDRSLDAAYLFYFLSQDNFRDAGASVMSGAVGHKRVPKEFIEGCPIPLPPLPEQKRIVAILDEAFAGIDTAVANTEKNLANARELFESYLNSVFSQRGEGWVEKPLEKFVDSISTGPFGSLLHKSDYVSDGVPLVNPINIVGDKIVPDQRKMINGDVRRRLQTYVLKEGDVVIARRGEIGRCAVVTDLQNGWVCGTGCFFIRPVGATAPTFLAHLLRSVGYRKELERLSSGATMLNLSNKALSNLRVSMPGIREQKNAVEQVSDLSAQCQAVESIYQQKLTALAELKQSLLQKAFSGELTADHKDVPNPALKEEIA